MSEIFYTLQEVGKFSNKPNRCSAKNCAGLYMVCQSGEVFERPIGNNKKGEMYFKKIKKNMRKMSSV